MTQFNRILAATDLTPASTPAIEKAIKIARENGAKLLIVHVYRPPHLTQAESVGPGVYEEWDANLRANAERGLQPFIESSRRQLVDAQPLALPGIPHKAILEAAMQNGIDLLVMGTHGRSGVSRLLLGSVAARVISSARCPVLTVRGHMKAPSRAPLNRPPYDHRARPTRLRSVGG